jgi:hypothetical protein
MLEAIMRAYSYLFHTLLSLFFLGLGIVAVISGFHTLSLDLLPWSGRSLTYWLLGLGFAGLAAVYLAFKGVFRWVFLVWTVLIVVGLLWGYFLTPYYFGSAWGFAWAMVLLAGAALTVLGAYNRLRMRPPRGVLG